MNIFSRNDNRFKKKMQVQVEILQIESDDVANELTEQVSKRNITKLVIGTSSRGLLSR